MYIHTRILSTGRVPISEEVSVGFVTALIKREITKVEYLGQEIDNFEDYIDEDMQKVSDQIPGVG